MEQINIFGIDIRLITTVLAVLVLILFLVLIFVIRNLIYMNRKYSALMSGKKGADLEQIIRVRFKEMNQVKANAKRITKEHKKIKVRLKKCYCKMGLVKYDAFNDTAGKLSFALAILNEDNDGVVLNSMHSREGCFTYAKEITNGESYIPLCSEEIEALDKAKTVEEEIEELTALADSENDIDFDLD